MYRVAELNDGFTLTELTIVIAVLAIISLIAVSKVGRFVSSSKVTAAESDLICLKDAFLNPETGYIRDMRGIPGFSLGYLRVSNLLISTNVYGTVEMGDELHFPTRVDEFRLEGCARPEAFASWDEESGRGWRGPYVRHGAGTFPAADSRRFEEDATAAARGFYPPLEGLKMPEDFVSRRDGCSVYGFPGEPTVNDPWGNPYVLQIPPAQAFAGANTNLADEVRFRYARLVSAGPDGRLDTPCHAVNLTNRWETAWNERTRRLSRQAGLYEDDRAARGDDIVLFLMRNDVDEGRDE